MAPSQSPWPNLQPDILKTIATHLGPHLGLIRLRSICTPWRSILPPPTPLPPLPLPPPPSSTSSSSLPPPHPLSLLHLTTYLLTDPTTLSSFLITLHHQPNPSNTFSLLNPLSPLTPLPNQPISSISLLNYGITLVSETHSISHPSSSLKKVSLGPDFPIKGDLSVLGITTNHQLIFLKLNNGNEMWTTISSGRKFDDVIFYKGKFYATADKKGRLVVIDEKLQVIDLVPNLLFGCGKRTRLVEGSDGGLYLVDRVKERGINNNKWVIGVFKLDDKGRFWDSEFDLGDDLFFVGDHASFSMSRKGCNGGVRNVVFFVVDGGEVMVWDMKMGVTRLLSEVEECCKLYWPPSSWFDEGVAVPHVQ